MNVNVKIRKQFNKINFIMKQRKTVYVSKPVDAQGIVYYTPTENQVWSTLIKRQLPIVASHACPEFLRGIELLELPHDHIPQCHDMSAKLRDLTGWTLEPVPALIPADHFFTLLANRKFPCATFIRIPEELDYLQEPDIFHEVFGHCPLLTNQAYADFTQLYGKLSLAANEADRDMLARLYWFTVEFGLIQTPEGARAYGGGILSSKGETIYCVESTTPVRKPFNVLDALRTPYRIDIMQPIYYVLNTFDDLYRVLNLDLIALIREARKLGEFPPLFPAAASEKMLGKDVPC